MFNIADYLKKFARFEGDSALEREMVAKALKEVCDLEGVNFELRKGTLNLKVSPMVKSIVFMKKDRVLEYLKQNYPQGRISDIR